MAKKEKSTKEKRPNTKDFKKRRKTVEVHGEDNLGQVCCGSRRGSGLSHQKKIKTVSRKFRRHQRAR